MCVACNSYLPPPSLPLPLSPSLSPPPSLPLPLLNRHRLKEGFHITRAQSGIVTLTAQLSVTQPHSTSSLPMLLQYIIFSLNANPSTSLSSSVAVGGGSGYPTCELWVEPQYGTVTQAPAGLQYILGCTHTEIARKVRKRHAVYQSVFQICKGWGKSGTIQFKGGGGGAKTSHHSVLCFSRGADIFQGGGGGKCPPTKINPACMW